MTRDDLVFTLLAILIVAIAVYLRWHEFFGCVRDYALTVCVPRLGS
jgi:hypothetical protein